MLFLTLWLLVLILERSIATKQRSINLALETVLQFDNADDSNVINKVKDFLSQLQVLLNKKSKVGDNVATRRKKKYQFTDFVEDLITTVNSFEDNDLKQIIRILDKDFRTRSVDNDLIDDNVKRYVSRKLTDIKNQPATNIRNDLDRLLSDLQADKNKKSFFLDFVNSLYKRDSERKFSKLIKRLNLFVKSARKSKVVLKAIVEKVVNDVIFEHYNHLKDSEKDSIKRFVKAYIINDIATADNLKIKQRAKAETTQESINTNEKSDEIKPTKPVTELHLTAKTFKNIPNETTKKIFTHITLYPKGIRLKKISTGSPTLQITESTSTNEENIKDKSNEEDTKEINKILTNQSVEINVNVLLKQSPELLDGEDSKIVESFKFKSSPKVFQRALTKSKKNTKDDNSSSRTRSIETFGNLYRSKTSKRYNSKKITRLVTYNSKIIKDDRYFQSKYVDDIVKEKSVLEKKYFDDNFRRFNKPINLNQKKVPKSDIKETVPTTKQRSFTTKAIVPLIISTEKFTTPVVATVKSSTKTTQNVALNEIFDNESLTHFEEVTEKPVSERRRTNIEFHSTPSHTTLFENDSNKNINNMTTVSESEVSVAFNINDYIKNSEALNVEDQEKKKQIEERMKADLGSLLASPSTNSTTDGFTDIFKELEDAFDI